MRLSLAASIPGCDSLQTESFELLLLQHQSQLGVYAKSKECETEVPAVPRKVYQLEANDEHRRTQGMSKPRKQA